MRILFTIVSVLFITCAFAQAPGQGGFNRQGNGQNMNIGHLFGKVVDAKTSKGIEGATILLSGKKFDTATRKMQDYTAATLITEKNGDFSIDKLPLFGKYTIYISAVNYLNIKDTVSFVSGKPQGGAQGGNQQERMQQLMNATDKDLGNIKLEPAEANLGNVTVTASAKPFFEMGVDRKVFNVDKNIVSTGQTATELMKQIPSLNVDIDGNVTLRNASPTLFVDGRPTTLTLDQIPADIIDRVELITNPSAKYDASGGTAGILNIVLKKNKKIGYNGGIRAGIDSRGRFNGGGDINIRQNKVNFFLSGSYNQRKSKSTSDINRDNYVDPVSSIIQNSNSVNEGYFSFVRGGLDYFVDNRNTISVAANFNRGKFGSNENQLIDSIISNVNTTHSIRDAVSDRNFRNFGGSLSFRHNFAENGHDITADVNYNSSTNSNVGDYNTAYYIPGTIGYKYPSLLQNTKGSGYNKFLTIQSDYENQFNDKNKIEAGVRSAIRNFENLNEQYFFDYTTNQYELLPSISSKYKYTDQVYAGYATYSHKANKWTYQLGLRLESSNYDGNLIGKDSTFSVKYPVSLFPSAFVTRKLSDNQDLQLNYSRRINRPNFFQLLPFIDNSDPLNLSIGNPGLKPEFTNSFEVNYDYAYKKGANLLISAYYKQTDNLITNYIYRDVNPDTTIIKSDSVYYTTFVNANNSRSFGLEITNRITLFKIWDLTANVNFFNAKINGGDAQSNISSERWSWFAKVNNNVKIAKGWSVQISADYQARTVLPANSGGRGGGFFGGSITSAQGYIDPRYSFDAALRKEWTWKSGESLSFTLSMNDFLRTQLYKTYSESDYFKQYQERRRDPQILRLNIAYRFGKFDASLFKRKNTKADTSGGQDMMQ